MDTHLDPKALLTGQKTGKLSTTGSFSTGSWKFENENK